MNGRPGSNRHAVLLVDDLVDGRPGADRGQAALVASHATQGAPLMRTIAVAALLAAVTLSPSGASAQGLPVLAQRASTHAQECGQRPARDISDSNATHHVQLRIIAVGRATHVLSTRARWVGSDGSSKNIEAIGAFDVRAACHQSVDHGPDAPLAPWPESHRPTAVGRNPSGQLGLDDLGLTAERRLHWHVSPA